MKRAILAGYLVWAVLSLFAWCRSAKIGDEGIT